MPGIALKHTFRQIFTVDTPSDNMDSEGVLYSAKAVISIEIAAFFMPIKKIIKKLGCNMRFRFYFLSERPLRAETNENRRIIWRS